MRLFSVFFVVCILAVFATFSVVPEIDLIVSGWFAYGADGFYLRNNAALEGLKDIAFYGARVMVGFFLLAAIVAGVLRKVWVGLSAKAWLFLLLALLIGPGLFANVLFKDNWGRARPRDVAAFGGAAQFTPAPFPSDQCIRNCSFVSGDGAFGFFLPTLAYVFPRRRRAAFWGLMGVGAVFAGARIALGAHFLSDVFYAMVLVTSISALLHALMFGRARTAAFWREVMVK